MGVTPVAGNGDRPEPANLFHAAFGFALFYLRGRGAAGGDDQRYHQLGVVPFILIQLRRRWRPPCGIGRHGHLATGAVEKLTLQPRTWTLTNERHRRPPIPGAISPTCKQWHAQDTNASGDIFGGWLLSQMDIAGMITAQQKRPAAGSPPWPWTGCAPDPGTCPGRWCPATAMCWK